VAQRRSAAVRVHFYQDSLWYKALFVFVQEIFNIFKTHWRSHVLASSDCLEFGMSDAAALVLDEIAPEGQEPQS
jgi:hypothetical protein